MCFLPGSRSLSGVTKTSQAVETGPSVAKSVFVDHKRALTQNKRKQTMNRNTIEKAEKTAGGGGAPPAGVGGCKGSQVQSPVEGGEKSTKYALKPNTVGMGDRRTSGSVCLSISLHRVRRQKTSSPKHTHARTPACTGLGEGNPINSGQKNINSSLDNNCRRQILARSSRLLLN